MACGLDDSKIHVFLKRFSYLALRRIRFFGGRKNLQGNNRLPV